MSYKTKMNTCIVLAHTIPTPPKLQQDTTTTTEVDVDNDSDSVNNIFYDTNSINQTCTFTENEYCCSHVTMNCECSYDMRGFIYQLLPKTVTASLKITLQDVETNRFKVECLLPAREYLVPWESAMVGKPAAFQLFIKLVQFYETVYQTTSYWPDIEYFGDILLVSGASTEGLVKFIRPTKFTTYKSYLIGLRKLFLNVCHQCATNLAKTYGSAWLNNINTGKGVNIKHCKEATFINRPPPFVKSLQEAACRRDDESCIHYTYVDRFKKCVMKKKFCVSSERYGQTHLACPKTLSIYAQEGVTFECRLFPEARAFFSELGRSDKLHTVFCYPDELLDVHWFNEFWNTITQYRAAIAPPDFEFI